MTIEQIPFEKAMSLAIHYPLLYSNFIYGDEADYYLLSEDVFLAVQINMAIVIDGEIVYISDESLRCKLTDYLESE